MLQGSIEYQRHKMRRGGWPQDFEDSARSSLIIVKFILTRRVVYTLSSPVLRFKRTRSGGGLAIEKTGRGPRFLSRNMRWGRACTTTVVSRHVISAGSLWTIG